MNRREVTLSLAAMPFAFLRTPYAQPAERVRRIGYLTSGAGGPDDVLATLQTRGLAEGLRQLGWIDGQNIAIEARFSGSARDRIRANAKELIAHNPDVIFCVGGPSLALLLDETRTIPIVFVNVNDPVGSGFVTNLARPDGNATGIGVSESPIAGKWLQLLKEIAPHITRALVLPDSEAAPQRLLAKAVGDAAPSLGLTLVTGSIRDAADYDREIAAFAREPGGGLVALSNPVIANNMQRVHALAVQYRLPAIYSYPHYARTGGLISYGPDPAVVMQEATRYVDRILRGAKPGDLPVQQPAKFELVINLKTAAALGLTVPQSILARADEVIE